MANRQLVDYIKEQLSHGFSLDQVRTLLVQQGWSEADVQAAVQEAYAQHQGRTRREHHTHFLGVAIAAIIVLILGVALFLMVSKQTQPDVVPQPLPSLPSEPSSPHPADLSGWHACQHEQDSTAKDTCYKELNLQEDNYDCDLIEDDVERGFCYRAKESVLLKRYAA